MRYLIDHINERIKIAHVVIIKYLLIVIKSGPLIWLIAKPTGYIVHLLCHENLFIFVPDRVSPIEYGRLSYSKSYEGS
jgi:hypothetical protein